MLEHGIRVPTVGRPQATAQYAKRMEANGFDFLWIPDTPWLAGRWRDVYVHLTAAALATSRIRLGPGVTNPLTRNPLITGSAIQSIHDASEGRAELVVGTGYSSAYIISKKAATLASMREATLLWRSAFSGAHTVLPGSEITLQSPCPDLPIYLAASGMRALQLAGEVADGVLIMVGANRGTVSWALEQLEIGAQRAGRRSSELKKIVVVTAKIDDDKQHAIEEMRPAAAGIYKHRQSKTLLERAGVAFDGEIPSLPFVYPDLGHAVDWQAAKAAAKFVTDDAVEALIAVGSATEVARRIESLAELEIDAIWWRDEQTYAWPEQLAEAVSNEVIPLLRAKRS